MKKRFHDICNQLMLANLTAANLDRERRTSRPITVNIIVLNTFMKIISQLISYYGHRNLKEIMDSLKSQPVH